jgi:molecular chaperone DnaK (HSP70)
LSATVTAVQSICHVCKVQTRVWDKYCSNCGIKLTGFSVDLNPRLIYVGGLAGPQVAHVTLTIKNNETQPLEIDDIAVSIPDWLTLPSTPLSVAREQTLTLAVDVNKPLDASVQRLEVTIKASGQESYSETVRFFLSKPPEFEVESEVFRVFIDDRRVLSGSQSLVLKIVSGAAEVLDVRAIDPWVRLQKSDLPQLIVPPLAAVSESAELKASFTFNDAALIEHVGHSYPSDLQPKFYFRLSGHIRDHADSVKIPVEYSTLILVRDADRLAGSLDTWRLKPPRTRSGLELDTAFEIPYDDNPETAVVPARLTRVEIGLQNVGGTEWTPHDIEVLDRPAGVSIVGRPTGSLAARGDAALIIEVDGNAWKAGAVSSETLRIKVTGRSLEKKTTTTIEIPIQLRGLKPFEGVVAIDFGTTNSTCARVGADDSLPVMLPLGKGRRNSVPTVICYHRVGADGAPKFVIGEEAVSTVPETIVAEVKRRLGSREPINVRFVSEPEKTAAFLPEEIAGHFLRAFKSLIELELGATIKSCLITHPVVFLEPQIRALRRAFEMAGFEPMGFERTPDEPRGILFEPMGAALDFMSGRAGKILRRTETAVGSTVELRVGIFDFGGGTTDFTLMDVLFRKEPLRIDLEARIEAMGGATFGGHNVTLAIARHFFEQWKHHRESEKKSGDMPFEMDEIQRVKDDAKRDRFIENRTALIRMADEAKVLLSSQESDEEKTYTSSFLAGGWSDEKSSHPLHLNESELNDLISKDINDLVSSFEEMIATAQKVPDVIVACGNSSRLKLVPDLLSQRFGPKLEFVPRIQGRHWLPDEKNLENLKDGVVKGIGLQHIMTSATFSDVVMGEFPTIPPVLARRIGINGYLSSVGRVFHQVFEKSDSVPKDWTEVPGATLNRKTEIMILSTGSNTVLLPLQLEDGRWNPHVKYVGSLKCADFPTACCSDERLRKMRLEFSIDKDRTIRVRVQDPVDPTHHHEAALLPDEIFD